MEEDSTDETSERGRKKKKLKKVKAKRNHQREARKQAIASGKTAGASKSSMAMGPLDIKAGKAKVSRNTPNGKLMLTTACTGEKTGEGH